MLTATFPRWSGDGEPAFVFDLCRELVAAGFRVTVLAPHAAGTQGRETIDGIEVRRFRYAPACWEKLAYEGGILANLRRSPWRHALLPVYLSAQYIALLRCLGEKPYDAIHAHWIVPQGVLMAAARPFARSRPQGIVFAHGSDVHALTGRFWSWLRRQVAARADRMIAVSAALRERLIAEGCPAGKIDVIPMGTDLSGTFVPDDSPRSPTELLFVGRLVPGKGLDTLLQALPEIRRRHPAVTLSVVGAGPERPRYEALARQLGVTDCVAFLGAIPHEALPSYYRRAALLVLPSRQEGLGLVAVEALGCGCPVAASDLPALREVLLDGRAGALFRPDDPPDLAATVCRQLDDAMLRASLAALGRSLALERFDWRQIMRRYGELRR